MQRAVKRSQDSFDEITQKFERRINEITEMSRINEDRFRQEWGGFKNDDQKRWTNYSLSQEEQFREIQRQLEKYQVDWPNWKTGHRKYASTVTGKRRTQMRLQSMYLDSFVAKSITRF
jgi:hypothetical protein